MSIENWETVKLGEVCSNIAYGYTESAQQISVGPKFLRITDIQNQSIEWATVPFCPISERDFEKYKLEVGDIVIARTGATTGATAIIKSPVKAVFASYLIRYKIDNQLADPFFVGHVLNSRTWKGYVESIIGGSAQPGANAKQFAEFEFELPPLPTQRRIAAILTALDDQIALLRRQNDTLEKMAQAVWEERFGGGGQGEELPEGWRWGKLGEIVFNKRGQISTEKMTEEMMYVGLEHVSRKSLSLTEWGTAEGLGSNKFLFLKGDILFGKLRPYFHKVCIAPFDGVCSTDILVIQAVSSTYFGFSVFHLFSEELIAFTTSTADGTRMPRTNWSDLANFEIAIPPESVASEFNQFAKPVFEKITENILQTRTLSHLRDALLPRLMSGEIAV